jgi:hypothetical protein
MLKRLTSYSHKALSAMLGSTTERALANDASKKSVLLTSSRSSSSTPVEQYGSYLCCFTDTTVYRHHA